MIWNVHGTLYKAPLIITSCFSDFLIYLQLAYNGYREKIPLEVLRKDDI